MERLAKEKIAAQNRILLLKRELAQWDIDFTKLLPEQIDVSAVKVERTGETSLSNLFEAQPLTFVFRSEHVNDASGKSSLMYSSTSSLSSITTTSPSYSSNIATVSRIRGRQN